MAEHKARADAAQPSAGSMLSNIASTVAQAAVGGGEVCPAECMRHDAIQCRSGSIGSA